MCDSLIYALRLTAKREEGKQEAMYRAMMRDGEAPSVDLIDVRPVRTLQTIESWNMERRQDDRLEPRPNGLACPECGLELMDSEPNCLLLTSPPQKRVKCECGYEGLRVA